MATIIAVDCSLSMARMISNEKNSSSKLECAKECTEIILTFLQSQIKHKLGQVAVIMFSSKADLLSNFVRLDQVDQIIPEVKKVLLEPCFMLYVDYKKVLFLMFCLIFW